MQEPPVLGTIDRFELHALVGKGPFSRVYSAVDTVTTRPVALKVLPHVLGANAEEAGRFRKALLPVAHVRHPHLLALRHLHEVWEVDDDVRREADVQEGSQVLITDLLLGRPLDRTPPSAERFQEHWQKVQSLVTDLAAALHCAHEAGVAHGVLSPGNIMMTDAGAVLLDLGVAWELRLSLSRLENLALPETLGAYAAAEQTRGDAPTPAADQFALAALLVDCMSGDFDRRHVSARPIPGLNDAQNAVIARALASTPDKRFASCPEFAAALKTAAAAEPIPLKPQAPTPAITPPHPNEAPSPTPEHEPADTADTAPASEAQSGEGMPPEEPPTHTPRRRFQAAESPVRPTVRLLNWAIAASIVALVSLAGAALYLRVLARQDAAMTEPMTVLESRDRLARRFLAKATFNDAPTPDSILQLRLDGQVSVLRVALQNQDVTLSRQVSRRERIRLAGGRLPRPPRKDDAFLVAKETDGIAVFFNGVRLLSAPAHMQEWIAARWESNATESMPVTFAYQKIGPLVFADDFMHGEEELGQWQPVSGTWRVHALQNPVRSANPFSFFGQGDDALATAGLWFWRNYQLSCAVHPLEGSAFGVTFCRIDADNRYDLLWAQAKDGETELILSRIADGKATILARKKVHLVPAFWVKLAVAQLDGAIAVSIDGRQELWALDPEPLLGGQIGLRSQGGKGTVFDDVEVSQTTTMSFDLKQADALPHSVLQGLPEDSAVTAAGLAVQPGKPQTSITVRGMPLQNATLAATLSGLEGWQGSMDVSTRASGTDRLMLRVTSTEDTWRAAIIQVRHDGETELAAEDFPPPPDVARISCHVIGNELWGVVNNHIVCISGQISVSEPGLCGIHVAGTAGTLHLESLAVMPETALPPIENRVETFTHEESMQNWNSPVLEWIMQPAKPQPVYWHRSDFWQDLSLSMDLQALAPAAPAETWGLAFGTARDNETVHPRITFTLAAESRLLTLAGPQGEVIESITLERGARQLLLARRGGRLLAYVDDALLWHIPLPTELEGLCRAGRVGRGSTVPWAEAVTIRAAGVQTYAFNQAPVDWVPAAGTWEVTNRWQCDPRWSFFSGVQRHGPACIWNKRRHGENLTVEFFAGPKMDADRGRRYEYAGDLNAVICADGKDITSGYSFMFGGWNDRGSQIVRNKTILKENRELVVPRHSSTHRRWFHVKLRKQGGLLTYWIDGNHVATIEDPEPLGGDRFGIWTWDNGMMLAQLRVASNAPLTAAPLGRVPPQIPETPYD